MKFSKSHRQLGPQIQFTPPCNYYDPHQSPPTILTGSLAGPMLPKEQTLFGLEKRFKIATNEAPGPGSYSHPNQATTNSVIGEQRTRIRGTQKLAFIGASSKTPSIPYHPSKLDEQQLEYVQELLMAEDVNKSALSLKPKADGYTFSKSPRTTMKKDESKDKNSDIPLQSINQYTQKKETKQRARNQMMEQVKRTNERRQQIMNMINPEFVPSLQLIQIITRRRTKYNPGPGSYAQAQTPRQAQQGVVFTTSKRFSQSHHSQLGPGQYQLAEQKKKSVSFSKSARNLFDLKAETDLQHRFYIDPLKSIKESSSVAKLNSHPFGSKIVRFTKIEKEQPPPQMSLRAKKLSKLEQVVEKRLKKMQAYQKKSTCQSQGLLGISTMASTIQ